MQKPQILWRNQTPSRSSLKLGWRQLSSTAKLALITFSLLYLSLSIYSSLKQQSAFSIALCLVSISSMIIMILHANGFAKDKLGSLMNQLKAENNKIWVGDYQLPDTVRKVVIGRMDIQGPAYLQLAWNQGHQWIFQLDELQQVRHFFRQHAPQIDIVNE
ncbi:hypothetical protein [Rheinheimera sp. MM224]|uniref:hypothetical protein n=1 Tax=Rheinheimera sp. MM224 TaxID=3019969 RepID=UPI0021F89E3B|nr:hypothetical protein [Rheinheimera sp. MM224]CAI3805820.1 hypothetical protein JAMGFMIE_03974 [Rheinheimera sp. MM224]